MDLRRVLKKKVRRNRRLTALAAHGHYHEIEGSLEKLARERKILSLRRWQPRYFKAMGHYLMYSSAQGEAWLGGVDIQGDASTITTRKGKDGKLVLTVVGLCADAHAHSERAVRTLKLRATATTEHSLNKWSNTLLLNRAALRAKGLRENVRAAALEYATLHSATTAAPSALAGGVPAAAPTTEHTIDVAPTFSPPSAPAIPPRRGLTVCRNEPAIPPQKVALVKGTGSDRHTSLSQPIRSPIGGSEDPLRSCLRSAREESEVGDEVIDVGDVAVTRRPRSSSGVVVDVAALGLPQQTPEAIRRSVSGGTIFSGFPDIALPPDTPPQPQRGDSSSSSSSSSSSNATIRSRVVKEEDIELVQFSTNSSLNRVVQGWEGDESASPAMSTVSSSSSLNEGGQDVAHSVTTGGAAVSGASTSLEDSNVKTKWKKKKKKKKKKQAPQPKRQKKKKRKKKKKQEEEEKNNSSVLVRSPLTTNDSTLMSTGVHTPAISRSSLPSKAAALFVNAVRSSPTSSSTSRLDQVDAAFTSNAAVATDDREDATVTSSSTPSRPRRQSQSELIILAAAARDTISENELHPGGNGRARSPEEWTFSDEVRSTLTRESPTSMRHAVRDGDGDDPLIALLSPSHSGGDDREHDASEVARFDTLFGRRESNCHTMSVSSAAAAAAVAATSTADGDSVCDGVPLANVCVATAATAGEEDGDDNIHAAAGAAVLTGPEERWLGSDDGIEGGEVLVPEWAFAAALEAEETAAAADATESSGTSATSLDTTRAEDAEDDEDGRVCDDDDDDSINDGVAQDAAESAGRGEEGNEVGGDEVVVEIVEEKESFAEAALRRVAQRAEERFQARAPMHTATIALLVAKRKASIAPTAVARAAKPRKFNGCVPGRQRRASPPASGLSQLLQCFTSSAALPPAQMKPRRPSTQEQEEEVQASREGRWLGVGWGLEMLGFGGESAQGTDGRGEEKRFAVFDRL